ncbi:MAG: prepilin-type N-terminal cleavage/methylation domain-containing protein [Caldiserica bacterium]|jgi:prepilin-type N-terminal cleavage/methylation domain-containing protein|nr:prepilin-type N-terminal cleavage/methylation domain-containing protein [Caldisericota bacterium]MDH7561823.1 prepilin-type N-terminal cleavage/methylation domain-containing protein [Caldisericota bacterium]
MMENRGKQKGISLIEMIVAIAIMAIMLGMASLVLTQGIRMWQREASSVSLEDQLRSVADRILRDIRLCYTATALNNTTLTATARTSTGFITYTYGYNSGTKEIWRKINNGSQDPIASDIAQPPNFKVISLTETSTPPLLVEIAISSSRNGVTKTVTLNAYLRNK